MIVIFFRFQNKKRFNVATMIENSRIQGEAEILCLPNKFQIIKHLTTPIQKIKNYLKSNKNSPALLKFPTPIFTCQYATTNIIINIQGCVFPD